LIPVTTSANNRDEIKVLSLEKVVAVEMDRNDHLYDLCNKWKLGKKEITRFFLTAKKSIDSDQINSFNFYNCNIKGELLINGIKKEYSIDLGGVAVIHEGDNAEEIVFGCSKGECLKYVHNEPYINHDEIKVLSIKKVIKEGSDDYLNDLCNKWNLGKKDIARFFLTAEKYINSAQISAFDVYTCEINGELLINGVNKSYSIDLGGLAFISGENKDQIAFGCYKGECLKYVHYEPYID
jgi:hypothetical protein